MDSSVKLANTEKRMPTDQDEMAQSPQEYIFKSKFFKKNKKRPQQSTTTVNSPKGGSGAYAPRLALII